MQILRGGHPRRTRWSCWLALESRVVRGNWNAIESRARGGECVNVTGSAACPRQNGSCDRCVRGSLRVLSQRWPLVCRCDRWTDFATIALNQRVVGGQAQTSSRSTHDPTSREREKERESFDALPIVRGFSFFRQGRARNDPEDRSTFRQFSAYLRGLINKIRQWYSAVEIEFSPWRDKPASSSLDKIKAIYSD